MKTFTFGLKNSLESVLLESNKIEWDEGDVHEVWIWGIVLT